MSVVYRDSALAARCQVLVERGGKAGDDRKLELCPD
jgi:hypothetical protein